MAAVEAAPQHSTPADVGVSLQRLPLAEVETVTLLVTPLPLESTLILELPDWTAHQQAPYLDSGCPESSPMWSSPAQARIHLEAPLPMK